jgi:hypothetical protein
MSTDDNGEKRRLTAEATAAVARRTKVVNIMCEGQGVDEFLLSWATTAACSQRCWGREEKEQVIYVRNTTK